MEAQKSLAEDWLLWGLLGGALLLSLGYYGLGFLGEETGEVPWVFQGVDFATITTVRSFQGDRLNVEVTRTSGEGWRIVRPSGVKVDNEAVEHWISNLLDPRVKKRFRSSDPGQYGFADTTTRRVEIVQKAGRNHQLYLGGESPVGQGVYVRYGSVDKGPVFVLSRSARNQLFQSLRDVRRKKLFRRQPEDVSSLIMEAGGDRVAYARSRGGTGWTVETDGDSQSLNDTQVRALEDGLSVVLFLEASAFYDTEPPAAMDPVRGRLILDYGDTTTTLDVGGLHDGSRVLRKQGWPPVEVDQDPVGFLDTLPHYPDGWPEASSTPDRGPHRRPSTRPPSAPGLPGASR